MIVVELVEYFRYFLGKGNHVYFRYWGNDEFSVSVQVNVNRDYITSSIWQVNCVEGLKLNDILLQQNGTTKIKLQLSL